MSSAIWKASPRCSPYAVSRRSVRASAPATSAPTRTALRRSAPVFRRWMSCTRRRLGRLPSAARSSACPPTIPASPAAAATSATAPRARAGGAPRARARPGARAPQGSVGGPRPLLLVVLERAEHELPGLGLEQHLDPLLDLGQALPERAHQRDAALEGGERLLERQLALLQALHQPFQLGQSILEARRGGRLGHHGSFSGSVPSMRARARPRANTRATASPAASVSASRTTGPVESPRRTMA